MNTIEYNWQKIFHLSRCGGVIFICLSFIFSACLSDNSNYIRPFKMAETGDYSQVSWIEAYDVFHGQISEQYAFGEWKSIDWAGLNNEIRPKIVHAMESNDETTYATALREYTSSLPDGHVCIGGGILSQLIMAEFAGSYGFGIIGLDDGRVIAHIVLEGGEAAKAGMEVGDEILEWNGQWIIDAVEEESTLWWPDSSSLATDEHTRLEKYRMLTLDPINTQSQITFLKSDGSNHIVTLTALDDNNQILNRTGLWKKNVEDLVQYKVLDSGYGYVIVGTLNDIENPQNSVAPVKTISEKFKEAMEFLTEMNVPGMIIDLRGNGGGSDELAAELAGYFYSETTFYEYQSFYNALSGEFENILFRDADDTLIGRDTALNISPQTPHFSGPIVCIVNPISISSAEGVAMAIQNSPRGQVASFYGTNGSFGMTGGKAILPGGYEIEFPNGRSLDQNGIIQLDSKDGIGGVVPDIRIPRTSENVIRFANGEDVELAFAIDILQQM